MEWLSLPPDLTRAVEESPRVTVPGSPSELYGLLFDGGSTNETEVGYPIDGRFVPEATVTRCRNGAVVNYREDYMRRRDPDSMRIADELPTDKPRFQDCYGYPFSRLREETMGWLGGQELILLPFLAGGGDWGYEALLVCPRNAAFFAYALALLQTMTTLEEGRVFRPKCLIYVAPPFRHTHFSGKQVVVHSRSEERHEIFSYNLYPGPSAKKGVYSFLLDMGEREGWTTLHASCAKVITPYENELIMAHEGASGGGKSELLQALRRGRDGRILLGRNVRTGERVTLSLRDTCRVEPVVDDMAVCLPQFRTGRGKLALADGEGGWFLRVDGVTGYGCDPVSERATIHTPEPLVFFNLQAVAGSTCLLWDHIRDTGGAPCPNPRVILPRDQVEGVVAGPVEVDVRSFGVRMPPATGEAPSCGVAGLVQVLPPALAWLWRLVSPRGYHNPSVTSAETLSGEGVGSYWPFATGRRAVQAGLLLEQILSCPETRYVLIPNQHVGAWEVGFAGQWVVREYLARRGGVRFPREKLTPARCPLLGWSLREMRLDGQEIPPQLLRPELQEDLGEGGYDRGAQELADFFTQALGDYAPKDLPPVGRAILDCFRQGGRVEDYEAIIPMKLE